MIPPTITLTYKTVRGNPGSLLIISIDDFRGIDEEMSSNDTICVSYKSELAGRGFVETGAVMETREQIGQMVMDATNQS